MISADYICNMNIQDPNAKKQIVITGASSGIGLELARKLISLNHKLYLIIRNPEKEKDLRTDLLMIQPRGSMEIIIADLSEMKQVVNAAEIIRSKTTTIDILINNAGGIYGNLELSSDGFERTFACNYLSNLLLLHLLAPLMEHSKDARSIQIVSEMYRFSQFSTDYHFTEREYETAKAYANSKMAQIMFTQWAAENFKPLGINVNCIHPGLVDTAFGANSRTWIQWGMDIIRPFIMSAEKAIQPILKLALDEKYAETTGEYFKQDKESEVSNSATDSQTIATLMDDSLKMIQPYLNS